MDDELQRFRARWQREVAERHARRPSAPAARGSAPAAVHDEAPPALADVPQVAAPRDRLTDLLEALLAQHTQAVLDWEAQVAREVEARRVAEAAAVEADAEPPVAAEEAPVDEAPVDLAAALRTEHLDSAMQRLSLAPDERAARTSPTMIYSADVDRPTPIARVPDEVLVHILAYVLAPRAAPAPTTVPHELMTYTPGVTWRTTTGIDYIALENAARTCWRLRLLSAQPRLWRAAVLYTYVAPQALPLAAPRAASWRDVFLHEPRLKCNGVYIATCHYVQHGLNTENVWVNVLHKVEFFRFLRFFPNGRCISLLTSERPADMVHQLEPGMRAKGLAAGRWHLLPDDGVPPARRGATIVIEDLHDPTLAKYTFQMSLHLRQSAPGRWNRLDMLEYASLHLETGEVVPIPHKHNKPFFFSRVVSYGA